MRPLLSANQLILLYFLTGCRLSSGALDATFMAGTGFSRASPQADAGAQRAAHRRSARTRCEIPVPDDDARLRRQAHDRHGHAQGVGPVGRARPDHGSRTVPLDVQHLGKRYQRGAARRGRGDAGASPKRRRFAMHTSRLSSRPSVARCSMRVGCIAAAARAPVKVMPPNPRRAGLPRASEAKLRSVNGARELARRMDGAPE